MLQSQFMLHVMLFPMLQLCYITIYATCNAIPHVAVMLQSQFMLHVMPLPTLHVRYLYISTFRSLCAVPNVAVCCSSIISCLPVRCLGILWMTLRWFQSPLLLPVSPCLHIPHALYISVLTSACFTDFSTRDFQPKHIERNVPVFHSPKGILRNRSFAKHSNRAIWNFVMLIDMVGKVQICIAYPNVRKSSLVDCFIMNVIRRQLSSAVVSCCRLSSAVVRCRQLSSPVVSCCQLLSVVVSCCHLSSGVVSCCQLSSNVVNCPSQTSAY